MYTESRTGTGGATPFSCKVAYDTKGRLVTRTTAIAGKDYSETSAYDGYGRARCKLMI